MNKRNGFNILYSICRNILTRLFFRPKYKPIAWPDGKSFAFTIIDDTDMATVENVKPIYDYLYGIGMPITKTIWVMSTNEPSHLPNLGESLENAVYRSFILDLKARGFEIALHGIRGGMSKREEILQSLEKYKSIIGEYPNIHINHSINKDNLYWGVHKLDFLPLRLLYGIAQQKDKFQGHLENSNYFWGDMAKEHISFVVNFSFHEINLLRVFPNIPYYDPRRPYVNYWFHSSDCGDINSFIGLLCRDNLNRLENEGGLCIAYTHFGKGFCENGQINDLVRERLDDISSRNGWFVPASVILNYMKMQHRGNIKHLDKIYIDLSWALEKVFWGAS